MRQLDRRHVIGALIVVILVASLVAVVAGNGDDDIETGGLDTSTTTTRSSTTTDTTTSTTTTTEPSTSTGDPTTTGPTSSTAAPTSPPETPAPTTAPSSRPPGPRPLSEVRLQATPVGEFDVPIVYRTHPDGTGFVGERAGRVRSARTGTVVLDIRDRVQTNGEHGFLGMAFSRDGSRLYVSYSDDATDGDSVIAEYAFSGGRAQGAERELLRVDQPYANHNGGDIHLGPDGFLYITLGDGGSSGDPGDNGQNPSTLLGSILRIDPRNPSDGKPYAIPSGNPFVDGGGRPEVYLYGVRNPWRISFDPANGDLWVADVGQDQWEEITLLRRSSGRGLGANLGWNHLEGTHPYEGRARPDGAVDPLFEYSHSEGCSITGGAVYRGAAIPELRGAYLFGDFCRDDIRALRADGSTVAEERSFDLGIGTPLSFGVDAAGEILVLSQQGTIYELDPA